MIGAGSGHDLGKFLNRHPQAAGRLVFQDQGHVVRTAVGDERKGMTGMVHDFFEAQPVKGEFCGVCGGSLLMGWW